MNRAARWPATATLMRLLQIELFYAEYARSSRPCALSLSRFSPCRPSVLLFVRGRLASLACCCIARETVCTYCVKTRGYILCATRVYCLVGLRNTATLAFPRLPVLTTMLRALALRAPQATLTTSLLEARAWTAPFACAGPPPLWQELRRARAVHSDARTPGEITFPTTSRSPACCVEPQISRTRAVLASETEGLLYRACADGADSVYAALAPHMRGIPVPASCIDLLAGPEEFYQVPSCPLRPQCAGGGRVHDHTSSD